MPEGVQDTFRYKVELDTQGLSAQLASVRDIVSQGLGQATQAGAAVVGIAGGATNRISSDLMMGHQTILAAMPAQLAPSLPRMGIASTTLANVPGMPQTFGQEFMAATGISRAPMGVFPGQFQEVAEQRLRERMQMGTMGVATGVLAAGMGWAGGAAGGAAMGAMFGTALGPVGTIAGAIGGAILADTVMAPFTGEMEARMMDRARTMQIFGFNQFRSDERAAIADFSRQRHITTLFSDEQFNNIMPAMALAGFTRGIGRGDVGAFQERFAQAEQFFMEASFITGIQDPIQNARMARGFRRAGIRDIGEVGGMMRQARELSREMTELGDFVDPATLIEQQLAVGQAGMQLGMSPQRMMETFNTQAAMMNRITSQGQISDTDLALLGGTPGEAAQRLTMSLARTQRHPVMRAMALAFGEVGPGGRAQMNQEAMTQMASGRMSFASLAERLAQQTATGEGGTTKMLTLLANQQKLSGDQMVNQGQLLKGLTDDILMQANLEVTDGTRQFIMQRVFGVGEAESRALAAGLPMEEADKKRLAEGADRLQGEIKGAIDDQRGGALRGITEWWRSAKDTIGGFFDEQTRKLSEALLPPLQTTIPDRLESIEQRLSGMRSSSPITVGPIDFSENHGDWMHPRDPNTYQGFRAVTDSRHFPKPAISQQLESPMIPVLTRLADPFETKAG